MLKKKILDFFFEEVEEEVIEEVNETEIIVDSGKRLKPISITEEKQVTPVMESHPERPIKKEVKKPVEQPAKSIFIDDTPKKEVSTKKTVNSSAQSGYEFTHVISPMFGVSEKDLEKEPTPKKVAATKVAIPTGSRLGTVISPIYGADINRDDSLEVMKQKSNVVEDDEIAQLDVTDLIDTPQEETVYEYGYTAELEEQPAELSESDDYLAETKLFHFSNSNLEEVVEEEDEPNLFNQDF